MNASRITSSPDRKNLSEENETRFLNPYRVEGFTLYIPLPKILGAMITTRRSASRLWRKEVIIFDPPSTRMERIFLCPSWCKRLLKSTWPYRSFLISHTWAPVDCILLIFLRSEREVVAIMVKSAALSLSTLESSGTRSRLSTIIF